MLISIKIFLNRCYFPFKKPKHISTHIFSQLQQRNRICNISVCCCPLTPQHMVGELQTLVLLLLLFKTKLLH